jgi:mRNA interferase MazF
VAQPRHRVANRQRSINFADVTSVDFGTPLGSEAGFVRPAIILTADGLLRFRPTTVFVVPLTTTERTFPSHVAIAPDQTNGLSQNSWALVEQLRAVSVERVGPSVGNVGPVIGNQLLDILAMITGMP